MSSCTKRKKNSPKYRARESNLGPRSGYHLAKLLFIRSILEVYMHIHEEELIFSFLKTAVELIFSNGLRVIICFLICNFPLLNLICLC